MPALLPIIERSVALRAPADHVFRFVTDHRRLPEWAPGIARVELDETAATDPGGSGTVRTLVPRYGRSGREVVQRLDPQARTLEYGATDASLAGLCTDHHARLTCEAVGDHARVTFAVSARPTGSWWRWWIARAMFGLAVTVSLHNLRRRFGGSV